MCEHRKMNPDDGVGKTTKAGLLGIFPDGSLSFMIAFCSEFHQLPLMSE